MNIQSYAVAAFTVAAAASVLPQAHANTVMNTTTAVGIYGTSEGPHVLNNFDIHNSNMLNGIGIYASDVDSARISNDNGKGSTVNMNGRNATGITFWDTTGTSQINNTTVNMNAGGDAVFGMWLNTSEHIRMNNITVNLKEGGEGIRVCESSVTNDASGNNRITINSTSSIETVAAIHAWYKSSVNLHNTHISVNKGTVLYVNSASSIALNAQSSITSSDGNTLILNQGGNTVSLNGVNLDHAKDQRIFNKQGQQGKLDLALSNGTAYDGQIYAGTGTINVDIQSGASWNVTIHSNLNKGELSLGRASTISFVTSGSGDFTKIYTAAAMLEQGSILMLDKDADSFSQGDVITLFTGLTQGLVNKGALLVTADNKELVYEDLNNGQFKLTGEIRQLIPEPASATLALLGLTALTARRRRA